MNNSYENHKLQLEIETEEFQNSKWLLNKFSPEFKEKIKYNSKARACFETLLAGGNPYLIIEELLKTLVDNEKKLELMIHSVQNNFIKPNSGK